MARNNDDKTGSLGFEDKLWAAADVLRTNMDPAEYKQVVLGLIFLKSKAIVDDGTVLPDLILLWLLANREIIRAKADGAGHGTKRLPTEVLHAHATTVAPRREQERIAAPLVHLLARVEQNLAESTSLAVLHDTLLPKLISGELRVPEAEELVEAAT